MVDVKSSDDLRSQAVATLRKKSEFRGHIAAYILVNAMLIAIWAMTGADFFWPLFPLLGWGIGLFFHGWDVYSRGPTEEQIQREMRRLG